MMIIASFVIAGIMGCVWLYDKVFAMKRELKLNKAKDSSADAEKIVDAKTTDDLVDDFNKRYENYAVPSTDGTEGGKNKPR